MFDSSESLLITAFFLADRGYDVWLLNTRGNKYSRRHVSKNPDDPASGFWNFTWTEIGTMDHPAEIDYILAQTNFEKVNYIGYSEGTTTLFVLLSQRPDYNRKINIASLMAPIVFTNHIGSNMKNTFEAFLSLQVRWKPFCILCPYSNFIKSVFIQGKNQY